MLGREGERKFTVPQRRISWLMQPTVICAHSSNSFFKDGRRIRIGDCALFKPPQDSPPFIGLIRCLTLDKENNLLLGVNWLYRPAELKLGKVSLLDCAPNEVFYSFHKDESIPAASLLHQCKVAFLPRGAELPKGASSFICRRVYDIANKCLWWLTDQDYVNERQEELDKLLQRTKTEMHATLQPGGRSPKQGNGPNLTSQAKSGPDSVQNSPTSFSSQVKGKKRERGDHTAEPFKRERISRTDDCDSTQNRPESHLKTDIGRITEKGAVVDVEGVEKLVQLMQPDRMEKKMDLASRSILAGVLASTDKVDCLARFVQLRGLPILDEWLQDIHKSKVGDNNSSKDVDKSMEDFLLVLLRALDKIPVNLHALQMCNIGRSVNHLRSHRNLEIQRKARGLVDTWKKRVEAEMNNIDSKSVTVQSAWPSKSRLPEAAHGVCRTTSGSEIALKSSITQHSIPKTTSIKSSHGESNTKSSSSSPGPMKRALSPASGKESHSKNLVGGTADLPLAREDKSSSSNQSHNSLSITGKEDGKGSTAVSAFSSKISSNSSRNRRNTGASPGITGGQKDNSSSRSSSSHRGGNALEKLQSTLTGERVSEAAGGQAINHNKLIVKIPNRVPSPAQGVSVGSLEDPTIINSQASSPLLSDKQEQFDGNFREKSDAYRSNVSSSKNMNSCLNDTKDVLNGSVVGDGTPVALLEDEQSMKTEGPRSLIDGLKTDQLKSRKLHETSFSPMNALIESCVKHSEAHSSLSLEDDVGMNLLASVATGEMSKPDMLSPADSTDRRSPVVEEVCNADEVKSKPSLTSHAQCSGSPVDNHGENDDKKKTVCEVSSRPGDGSHTTARNCDLSNASTEKPGGEELKPLDSVSTDLGSSGDRMWESSDKLYGKADTNKKIISGEVNKEILEEEIPSSNVSPVYENKVRGDLLDADEKRSAVELEFSDRLYHGNCKGDVNEDHIGTNRKLKSTSPTVKSENLEKVDNEKLLQTSPGSKFKSEISGVFKAERLDENDKNCNINVGMKVDRTAGSETAIDSQCAAACTSTANHLRSHSINDSVEQNKNAEKIPSPERGCSTLVAHESKINYDLVGSTSAGNELEEADSLAVADSSSSAAAASDPNGKIKFDLNEGFSGDDGKYGEPVDILASVSTTLQIVNSLPFVVNSVRGGHSASVTVAAAAKGPFVPPDDLLRSKGELGWRGSAATSAFRPAEPRKAAEFALNSRDSPSDACTSKHGRVPLDFDLNVPDERLLEELSSRDSALSIDPSSGFLSNLSMLPNEILVSVPVPGSGGLDLDLNRADEVNEKDLCSTSSDFKREGPFVHMKPLGALPVADVRRDFDLNDGPGVDDSSSEHVTINQQIRAGTQSHLLPRMNYPGLGGLSTWFPAKNTFSTVTIPSMIPDRGDQTYPVIPSGAPHRTFGPAGVTPFNPDVYRGSVLSSSPAMSFPSSPFQYSVFPFGTTFPHPSATFPIGATPYADSSSGPKLFAPPVNSHLLGPVGAVSSQFQRPYMVSLPDGNSNGGSESSRRWVREGLDLNAGPGASETELRNDSMPLSSSQNSVVGSQAQAEEHARMYTVAGGVMKRKEPEEGWGNESFRYKQPSWQ